MRDDTLLGLLFLAPPVLSLAIAVGVMAALAVRSRAHPASGFAWPAVCGAVLLPPATFAMVFAKGSITSFWPALYLVWTVAAGFCVLGLIVPPPPARRWMFAAGLGSIGLSILFFLLLYSFGRSLGRMH